MARPSKGQGRGLLFAVVLIWAFVIDLTAALDNDTTPVSFFYSRPDLLPPILSVQIHDESKVEPGYIFITPYQEEQAGPYIYDKYGTLIWSGFGEGGPYNAHNFYPCDWMGRPHLCLFQGTQMFGYARGHGIIMNQDYKIVRTVESVGEVPALDQHEFRLTDNKETFLASIYQQVPYDLSRIDRGDNIGWVMDSLFQEINSTDNSIIFQWSALNHVSPFTSYVYPETSDISGSGYSPTSPWDWFHINSIVKSTFSGNYLISARHMSSLYYINATDGSVIWKLQAGGDSDFVCEDFNFGFQHDAEIHAEDDDTMFITLYDNAFNNANSTAGASSAKFIKLDLNNMIASLYRPSAYYEVQEGMDPIRSASQGNVQMLKNENVFVGWGDWPRFSEHDLDGKTVWQGRIGPYQGANMVYRAYSGAWKSIPSHSKPSLWTYARTSDSLIALYVSWNGCTEIEAWNFYGANDMNAFFEQIGTTKKDGFETVYTSESHYRYTFAEAVAADGTSLRNSSMQMTFVPSSSLAVNCNDLNCNQPPIR